jgi:hypothetical protein
MWGPVMVVDIENLGVGVPATPGGGLPPRALEGVRP